MNSERWRTDVVNNMSIMDGSVDVDAKGLARLRALEGARSKLFTWLCARENRVRLSALGESGGEGGAAVALSCDAVCVAFIAYAARAVLLPSGASADAHAAGAGVRSAAHHIALPDVARRRALVQTDSVLRWTLEHAGAALRRR